MRATFATSPYIGLQPYNIASANLFFGRGREIQRLTASMFAFRLTLAYGPSGVGKTSILSAGVPARWQGRADLLLALCRNWQYDPLLAIKAEVGRAAAATTADFNPPDQQLPLDQFLAACATQLPGRRFMIILDQFEEFILYHPYDTAFAAALQAATMSAGAPVSFLLALREEDVGRLERFRDDLPDLFNHIVYISPLTRSAARQVITEPLTAYNQLHAGPPVTIEPDLVERVLDEVAIGLTIFDEDGRGMLARPQTAGAPERETHPVETPYLQMVLTTLWDAEQAAGSNVLRLQTLMALGGAMQIVSTHLDRVMAKLTAAEQEIAAAAFMFLITPTGRKIAYTVNDLAEYTALELAALGPVLEKLAGSDIRILRMLAPPPERPDASRYEIFHDILAPAVLDWRRRYVSAQEKMMAARAAAVEKQRAAEEARAKEQSRLAGRLRGLIAVATVLLLALAAAAVVAGVKIRQARASEAHAKTAEQKALDAQHKADDATKRADTKTEEARKAEETAKRAQAAALSAQSTARIKTARAQQLSVLAKQEKMRADKATSNSKLFQSFITHNPDDADYDELSIRVFNTVLASETNSLNRANTLTNLGNIYAKIKKIPEALNYYKQALALYQQDAKPLLAADRLIKMGDLLDVNSQQEWLPAIRYYEDALKLYRTGRDRANEIKTLELIAERYRLGAPDDIEKKFLGNKLKSIEYYKELLPLYRAANKYEEEATVYEALANIQSFFPGEDRKKIDFWAQAAAVFNRAGKIEKEAPVLDRIADAYATLGETGQAVKYFERAQLGYSRANNNYSAGLVSRKTGRLYHEANDKQKALTSYEQAATFFKQINRYADEGDAWASIGDIYSELGVQRAAIDNYEKADAICRGQDDQGALDVRIRVLKKLSEAYQQSGQTEKALTARTELEALQGSSRP